MFPASHQKICRSRWVLRYKRTRIPGILLAGKTINIEATDVLDRICRPKLTIDQLDYRTTTVPKESNTYGFRDLSAAKLILQRIRHVNLEVEIAGPWRVADQALTIAVLRWMKAVINNRSDHPQTVRVDFRSEHAMMRPTGGHGLFEVVRDIRCHEAVCLRFVCWSYGSFRQRDEKWEIIPVPALMKKCRSSGGSNEVEQNEWGAWVALERACALRRALSESPSRWASLFSVRRPVLVAA